MRFQMCTLDDFQLQDKTVLCRVDINQPIDKERGELKSIARITACIPTVRELSDKGAKVVLLGHQGSDIEYQHFYTLRPHAKIVEKLLNRPVKFLDDICGPSARKSILDLKNGEVLLLDNVRFLAEEQTLFELKLGLTHKEQAKTLLVEKLAPLADLYVCDAFAAAHRDQPSLCGFQQVLPSAMGRLFEKEYSELSKLMKQPERPCTFILGGAKVADAFMMLEKAMESNAADTVLAGGLFANILLVSQGKKIGQGSWDYINKSHYEEYIEKGQKIYKKYKKRIFLPLDLAYIENGKRQESLIDAVPGHICAMDIGSTTIEIYEEIILKSGTVFANGPMGVFERSETELGTKAIFQAIGKTEGYSVIGGGDSITAATKYNQVQHISYVCTGGGALIRFLSGEELPAVKALRYGAMIFGGEK